MFQYQGNKCLTRTFLAQKAQWCVWVQNCTQAVWWWLWLPLSVEDLGSWDSTWLNVCLFWRGSSMSTSKRVDFYWIYVQFYFLILLWRFWPFKQLLNKTFLLESHSGLHFDIQIYTSSTKCFPNPFHNSVACEAQCLHFKGISGHITSFFSPATLVLSLCRSQKAWLSKYRF